LRKTSEGFTEVTTTNTVFWYLTNYTLANMQRRFGETGDSPLKVGTHLTRLHRVGEKVKVPVTLVHAINACGVEE